MTVGILWTGLHERVVAWIGAPVLTAIPTTSAGGHAVTVSDPFPVGPLLSGVSPPLRPIERAAR